MHLGLLDNMKSPLILQDLSGDIYYLENWLTQGNILEYAKEQLSEIGEFDIYIDSQNIDDEEGFLATETDKILFKSHLLQNPEGPQGMIVYQ